MALENQKFSNYIDENSLPEDWGGGGSSGISKTYITTVGDNSTTEFNINHNFGTDNVIVMVTDLLTKENRAIVSPIAGTTRDYIESFTTIHDIPVRLFDTAGLRDSDDLIESEGIKRSEKLINEADLVLLLLAPGEKEEITWKTKTIVVRTKSDLEKGEGLAISTVNGEGISLLLDSIYQELSSKSSESELGAISIDSERQRDGLARLVEMLKFILSNENESVDILALFFQSALSILGEITGEVTNEELLDTLFSNFCLGK